MNSKERMQLSRLNPRTDIQDIFDEVKPYIQKRYSAAGIAQIEECCHVTEQLFNGKMSGYRACNTDYHDLPHTGDVFLATARLLEGFVLDGGVIPESLGILAIIAALMHDSGYIQDDGDLEGTGAKYTLTHVDRSVYFVLVNKKALGLSKAESECVGRLIKGTDFGMDFSRIPYVSDIERTAGAILGTADLLGQMADRVYLEKLLFLYYEFREANIAGYDTEFDILKKTIGFYKGTQNRLAESFDDVAHHMRAYFREYHGIDEDLYQTAIDRNMAYLDHILADGTTNFRYKLKRGNLIQKAASFI